MSFKGQVSYNTLGNVVTLFCQWLIIMIIPKITNFSEAGVFAVAVSVSSITNQIAVFTLNQYQVAHQYEQYSENDFAITRVVTIALSFVCVIPISALFCYGLDQIYIILAYTLYRNLINFAYLHQSSLQIINRLDYAGKCMILEGLTSFSVYIGAYILFGNLLLSTLLMALIGGGVFLLTMGRGYREFMGHPFGLNIGKRDNILPLLKIGLPMMLSTLCPIIITALPKLILENQWGTELVGIFSTLTSPTIIVPTLAQAIFIPFTAYFANLSKRGEFNKLRIQYGKILVCMAIAAVFTYILSVLCAEPVFEMIYGTEISPYTDYFNILIIGIFLYTVGICGITVLITKNQGIAAGLSSVTALLFSAIVFMIWIPVNGMDGATWGLMASYGVFGLLITISIYLLPIKNDTEKAVY